MIRFFVREVDRPATVRLIGFLRVETQGWPECHTIAVPAHMARAFIAEWEAKP
jgi:hypothetical protein